MSRPNHTSPAARSAMHYIAALALLGPLTPRIGIAHAQQPVARSDSTAAEPTTPIVQHLASPLGLVMTTPDGSAKPAVSSNVIDVVLPAAEVVGSAALLGNMIWSIVAGIHDVDAHNKTVVGDAGKKNESVALLLGLVLPGTGIGSFYAGNNGHGWRHLGISVGTIAAAVGGAWIADRQSGFQPILRVFDAPPSAVGNGMAPRRQTIAIGVSRSR